METLVLLDDLDYLVMGGRISALAAKAVSIMNIKPVITFDEEGKIYIRHKSLGFKKGMKWLCEQAVEKGKDFGNTILGFAYCLDRSRAEQLADMVKSQVPGGGEHHHSDWLCHWRLYRNQGCRRLF